MSLETNVDAAEIDKFQSIASRWWDRDSEFKPLHEINPLRVAYIEKQAQSLAGKEILDVGCGGGILAEALAQRQAKVTGIDMAELSLKVARLHLHESGLQIDYRQSTVEAFAEKNAARFDIVTCLEMLEHVPDPASVIAAACRLLKPNGLLILSTLNRNPKSFALAIIGAEYVLGLLPRGTHEYKKFIKPSELAAVLRANGMRLCDTTGLSYNPITRSYSLGRDIDVNYLMTACLDD
ncbi:MAG: bifunctional 2-polyprenyl-6-hydroxyphenol methylase/3-demethylubiquinol 3-O-methyltransferase UbiG [Gammaproteobacteria bacterium]|nr:MAG: bifunctional 2-polyprenyl-6-hydroxyphenol methylase/3-demethylubiquinol 3-O-methyltransferase UbiG [Gammaproteobacteria bacterium]